MDTRVPRTLPARLLAVSMLGLEEALHGPRQNEPAIFAEAPGEPDDDPIELHLDPEHPERSVVILRPWRSPWGFPG